jgi:hypothetical protein
MRDILFFFGAGASFGAGSTLPEQPPLGVGLYSALGDLYPSSWGSLPVDIKSAFAGGNFESGMALLYERHGSAIPQLMRELAIYFIQFRPFAKSTLYCRLIQHLKESAAIERVAFSTLNYECVLEFSLIEHGLAINYFHDTIDDRVPVWKLHGSCNFFALGLQAGTGVTYGTGVTWNEGLQAHLDSNRVIEHCLVETVLAPVMSLYMKGKPFNVSPSVISGVQETWAASVASAAAVICIGVRPWPEDCHIWEPLASTPAVLLFVGGKSEFDAWAAAHRSNPSEHIANRFDSGFHPLLKRLGRI